ncbi:hypothetical protein AVEN_86518-1 [Araneus ventricosus]|uniref:Uncharacterized protein n=1 Tax=Araneus ventricosus TaxID=182803 RepID=A0A4Y2N0V2_ARAVE|nr:hypothetical protein AVEN_86518-1 [Araneus ventricosus]
MAYLARSRKEDLLVLAEELGLTVKKGFKAKHLHKLITESPSYDEEFTRELLGAIKEEREKKRNCTKKSGKENLNENLKKKIEPKLLNYKNLNWKSELQGHSPLNLFRYLNNL